MSDFYIGCAIWGFKGWLGSFFPRGTRQSDFLRIYSRKLSAVEGNTTFYAVPAAETVARWAAEMPETFRFCPKLPRDISHAGSLVAGTGAAAEFVDRMRALGPRLGPCFLQLPPTYGPRQLEDLAGFLTSWPTSVPLAVEVRHPAFFEPAGNDELNELLRARAVARVLMDVRPLRRGPLPGADVNLDTARDNKPDVPLLPALTAPFTLVRYIGHPQLELNDDLLDEWAARVASWLAAGTDVFFFCHCPDDTYSPALCDAFRQRLVALGALDPPEDEQLEQASLF